MQLQKIETKIENEYHVSWYIICYKLFLGALEFLAGIGILLFGKYVAHQYFSYAARELTEDPHAMLVNISEKFVPQLLTHSTYIVIYLILLGSAKIAGAIGLIYKRNWGVDLLVGLTLLMFPFQLVNVLLRPSLIEFLYILLGVFIAFYLIEFKPKAWVSRMILTYTKKNHK